jgi:hypothetical protein
VPLIFKIRADALVDFRGISLHPTKHGGMVYAETSLTHHLFDISIR